MNKYLIRFLILIGLLFYFKNVRSQATTFKTNIPKDSSQVTPIQKDIVDVFRLIYPAKDKPKLPNQNDVSKAHFTLVPGAGYTLQTGFAILMASNFVFYSDKSDLSKISTLFSSIAFTQNKQIIIPFFANVWSKGNKYNFVSDMRYMNYPSINFGVGPKSIESTGSNIDYAYLKLHQTVLKKVHKNTYLGTGVFYDYFWNISDTTLDGPPPPGKKTLFRNYDSLHTKEKAVGIVLKFLYDNRANQINTQKGFFASLIVRDNLRVIGSQNRWLSAYIELKKYIPFPTYSKNVLAFWSYNQGTLFGHTPYLLLPSTGWDDFFNTGRGYIQGRFRGGNLSYLEAEYRFRLLKNGLLGGVVFGNVQSFSKDLNSSYDMLIPGYGLGLRIKMNKQSSTNLCIDYGFGINQSRGFFVNLGEVF